MLNRSACAIVLLVTALFLHPLPGFAQDDPRGDNDPIIIPEGQTQVEYFHVEEMPRQLRRAFFSKCGQEQSDYLKDFPARIVKLSPRGRIIALVPCGRIIVGGRAFAFGRWWEPTAVTFTVMAHPAGFTTSENPGFLEWHPESLALTATQGNDVIDCKHPSQVRHTYSSAYGNSHFVLTKVEAVPDRCGVGNSVEPVTLWETPVWREKWKQ
jgi:hypothetical protein